MIEYVLGFAFSENKESIALIFKTKPEFQKNKLNGLGGKIEECETPIQAMRREFSEESGIYIEDWNEQCVMKGKDFIIHVFNAFDDKIFDVRTMEEEFVSYFKVDFNHFNKFGTNNLVWLIGMALDKDSSRFNPVIEYS